VYNKIHGRDIVVVDDDLVERLDLSLGLFDDLDFGEGLKNHFISVVE
jgi:hypothetical protein